MSRVTFRGKALLGSCVIAIGIAMMPSPRTLAQTDPAADTALITIANIQVWAKTIWKVYEKAQIEIARIMRKKIWLDTVKGNEAITKQVAANTTGVQSALQEHAAVMVEVENRALQTKIEDRNKRQFGSLGSLNFGGHQIGIGSIAPTACKKFEDATVIKNGLQAAATNREATSAVTERQNVGYGTLSASTAAMHDAFLDAGGGLKMFNLDWITRDHMTAEDVNLAQRSIAFATNPTPLVSAPRANTPAGREYQTKMTYLLGLMELPQEVLARQLSLRAPIGEDGEARSLMGVIDEWAKQGVADRLNPVALQAKTPKGVQVEMALTLKALLYVENERMRSDQERNAMLALMLSKQLQERQEALRADYNRSLAGG